MFLCPHKIFWERERDELFFVTVLYLCRFNIKLRGLHTSLPRLNEVRQSNVCLCFLFYQLQLQRRVYMLQYDTWRDVAPIHVMWWYLLLFRWERLKLETHLWCGESIFLHYEWIISQCRFFSLGFDLLGFTSRLTAEPDHCCTDSVSKWRH